MSTQQKSDVIVFGATGYTGRLITRYLASHPQFLAGRFSFSIAGRSQSKLHTLVQELSLPPNVATIQVDVTDSNAVGSVVKTARVILNTVGPYWRWGTPVVRECARNGVHYVDLTGESYWIKDIIAEFDYLATKTGAVIVPSCGMDSIPSDLSTFLSNKTLKGHGKFDISTSLTAFDVWGGISGGTVSSGMTMLEEVPAEKRAATDIDFSLSPAKGRFLPPFQLFYDLGIPHDKPISGAFFFMQPANRKLVQRTFGLLELQARRAELLAQSGSSSELTRIAEQERYGPTFAYDEFLVMRSRLSAFLFTTAFAIGVGMLAFVKPFRWLVKKYGPQPGDGPSDEDLPKGFITCTNHTTSTSNPPVHVKTVLKGNGDPGYFLTAIMISESALSLVLPPVSASSSSSPTASTSLSNLPAGLPALAYQGGILTPMSAFGDVLITRLKDSGKFEFESHVVGDGAVADGQRKTI